MSQSYSVRTITIDDAAALIVFAKTLELEVFADNARAQHVYEKLGFVQQGIRREVFLKDRRFVDSIMMSLLYPRPERDL